MTVPPTAAPPQPGSDRCGLQVRQPSLQRSSAQISCSQPHGSDAQPPASLLLLRSCRSVCTVRRTCQRMWRVRGAGGVGAMAFSEWMVAGLWCSGCAVSCAVLGRHSSASQLHSSNVDRSHRPVGHRRRPRWVDGPPSPPLGHHQPPLPCLHCLLLLLSLLPLSSPFSVRDSPARSLCSLWLGCRSAAGVGHCSGAGPDGRHSAQRGGRGEDSSRGGRQQRH